MSDGYQRLVDALSAHGIAAAPSDHKQMVKCPAHDDKTASLAISQGDDRALVHCHAGCSFEEVLAALGLNPADLYDKKLEPASKTIAETYDWTDEEGKLLYQSLRYRPKSFKQRRPDGNGGWVWDLQGARRVLYRLPELVGAVAENRQVIVVEGEKDADRLHREGLVGTTNPMGAGKWAKCETAVLNGADVVVLPDNDTAGRDHAASVAKDLTGRAASVRVLELPDLPSGGDVSDWLNNGGSADELRSLIDQTTEWTASGVAAVPLAEALDEADQLLDRFMHFESDEQRHAITLWAASTHVYDAYDVTPYLYIKSPEKRSGKSLLLDLLDMIVRSPLSVIDPSPAALYRVVEDRHPTLLIDEADTVFPKGRSGDPSREELRGLLNNGYRRGRPVIRVGGGRRDEIHEFDVFGPKALAGIGDLPDTVADRCITIALQRKSETITKQRYRLRKVSPQGAEIQDLLAGALAGMTDRIAHMDPPLPDELNDREQDTWELPFAVADIAGGDWPAAARRAAIKLSEESQDATETIGIRLLADMKSVWGEDDRALSSAVLVERLTSLEEAPWADWYGKPIDPRFLANKLRPYGVRSTKVKYGGKPLQGYRWEHLAPVWERYLPATPVELAEPMELPLQGKDSAVPHATEPERNPPTGSGQVPDRFPTENPYGVTEVPQVPQVPHNVSDGERDGT